MKRSLPFTAPLLAIAYHLLALPTQAHPGHGPGEVPSSHFLTNADHLGTLLAVDVIGFCLLNTRRWLNRNYNPS